MANTATSPGVELEPIDRLEEKVKRLVDVVERLRAEQVRITEENQKLVREVDQLRARTAAGEALNAEVTSLREERQVVRSRVADMLEQLEALSL